MTTYDFLFSVIVPIYNTEQYLEECIESVINQTIGFEHIHLILVNSGSDDGSEDICLGYQARFPAQVEYIKLDQNQGPSFARNAGISSVCGKYTVFLDSDDKWDLTAFENAYSFFEAHHEEIDVIAPRIGNFEAYGGWHALDYMFTSDRIINIEDEYNCIKTTIPAFIKSSALSAVKMDMSVRHNEDTKFMTELILKKRNYGVLRSAVYWYRRRRTQTSTQQTIKNDIHYYTDVLEQVHLYLLQRSTAEYGVVLPYIQYVVMYSMQWRLLDSLPNWMTEDDISAYVEKMRIILLQIDDYIICEQRNIYKEHKLFCLRLKYGDDIYSKFQLISGRFLFNNLTWCTTDNRVIFNYWWHGVDEEGVMRLTGEINFPFPKEDYEIFAQDDLGNRYPLSYDENAEKKKLALGQVCLTIRPFEVELPLERVGKIQFILCYQRVETPLYIHAGKFSRLSADPPESYSDVGGYLFTRTDDTILVEPTTAGLAKAHKRALWRGLFRRRDKRAIVCRVFAALLRRISGKQDVRISFGNERIV